MLSASARAVRAFVSLGRASQFVILLTLAAAVTAMTPIGRATLRALRPATAASATGDTIVVYGPKQFDSPTTNLTTHIERFVVPATSGVRYVLRVQNGDAGGAHRAPTAEVRLNGDIVATKDELAHAALLQKVVDLQATDTLRVAVGGAAGAFLTVSVLSVPDPTFVVWGPQTFQRVTGKPVEQLISFTVPAAAGSPQWLYLENGLADASHRVTSGEIKLNDVDIVKTDDLNQQVAALVRPVTMHAGTNQISVKLDGAPGSQFTLRLVATDTTAPTITILAPGVNAITRDTIILVTGTARDATPVSVKVNGIAATVSAGAPGTITFTASVPLTFEGANTLLVSATDAAGLRTDSTRVIQRDTHAPTLTVTAPTDHLVTNADSVTVTGTVTDASVARANVNGIPMTLGAGGAFSQRVVLADGANYLTITAVDTVGNSASVVRVVTRDITPPVLTVTDPADGTLTNQPSILVRGRVTDASSVVATVNGMPASVAQDGAFSQTITLAVGSTPVLVEARDAAGNVSSHSLTVVRDTIAPQLNVTSPADQATVSSATLVLTGTVIDTHATTVQVNGVTVPVAAGGAFTDTLTLVQGANVIQIVAFDIAGNRATALRTVTFQPATGATPMHEVLGADPALVAPAPNPLLAAPVGPSLAFLYTGPNAVQTGVAANAIDPVRAGVTRGRVLGRSGAPISGVSVTVAGHPELGQSVTRANGYYDVVANAGGQVVLHYAKSGYLAVQRHVPLQWQEMHGLGDVVLTPVSNTSTTIQFVAPIEVARGPVESDASGSRQATLMFAQGTQATLVLPDGSTRAAPSLTVRATEVTVGTTGPNAMPAPLPNGTEYTYAVDLSADEAQALGATVQFSAPVAIYVDNFLRFRPGAKVPVGYYDPAKASWIPQPSGRVVRVLDIVAGQAVLDAAGDSLPAPQATLDSLGVTPAELTTLATLYAPGATLWRAQTTHFSFIDFNWPAWIAAQVGGDDSTVVQLGPENQCTTCAGSIISVENQSLAERVEVQGTGLGLTYVSHRQPGASAAFSSLRIPILDGNSTVGDNGLAVLDRVVVDISVGGRVISQTFTPTAGQKTVFTWDGRDAYGRVLTGAVARVTRTYYTRAYYLLADAFGGGCSAPLGGCTGAAVDTRVPIIGEATTQTVTLARQSAAPAAVGGWSLDVQHWFDPATHTLLMGDGSQVKADNVSLSGLERFAGSSASGASGDGGFALNATFTKVTAVAAAPNGAVYVADGETHTVRQIQQDGTITTIVGTGTAGAGTLGGPASAVALNAPAGLAVGSAGELYVADAGNNRVLKIVNGNALPFAGGNGAGNDGDGGLATDAHLNTPTRLSLSVNNSLLILDTAASVVREVTADGRIRRLIGGGSGFGCDTAQTAALAFCLNNTVDLAAMPNGDVAVASANRIVVARRNGVMGVLADYAGSSSGCNVTDNSVAQPALTAGVCPVGIVAGTDGSLYVAQLVGLGLSRITPTGLLTPVRNCSADNTLSAAAPALAGRAATLARPRISNVLALDGDCKMLARAADGAILVAGPHRVDRLSPVLQDYTGATYFIPSRDGAELYEFSSLGQHRRTMDAMSGTTLRTFAYDSAGRVVSVTDVNGNATTIERGSDGTPAAIVSPYGERTTLAVNADGFLTTITDPAGQATSMTYATGGLLASFSDPLANTARFAWDSTGMLLRDDHPMGGSSVLARTQAFAGDTVSLTDSFGRKQRFAIGKPDGVNVGRQSVDAAGLTTTRFERADGTTTSTAADGTTIVSHTKEDPRFGNHVPMMTSTVITLPNGQSATIAATRQITLSNQADPSTLVSQTDVLYVAAQPFSGTYDAVARTYTTHSPEGRSTTMAMDSTGHVIRVDAGGLASIRYSYDSRGRLTAVKQGDRSESYTYNPQGRLATSTDAAGRVSSFSYDAAGRVTSQTLPGGRTIAFTYDAAGNLTALTPPGQPAHQFTYNAGNLVSAVQAPVVSGSSGTTTFSYSREKELLGLTRADSSTVSIGYDAAGRANRVTSPDGVQTVTYDPVTGQVTTLSAPGGIAQAFTYAGALPTSTTWSGPRVNGTVGVSYDQALRPSDLTVGGQSLGGIFYGADGLPVSIGPVSMSYRADNALLETVSAGSATTTFAYDSLGQVLVSATVGDVNADTLLRQAFTYDALGRIVALAERVQGDTAT